MSNISSANANYAHVIPFAGASNAALVRAADEADGSIAASPIVAAFLADPFLARVDDAVRKADSSLKQFFDDCRVIRYVPPSQPSAADESRVEALRHATVAGRPAGVAALFAGN